jgi:hypothetical protein
MMAQPLPRSPLSHSRSLRWIDAEPPEVDPERRRLARGLTLIALLGGAVFAYLCFLVRVSSVDSTCHQLETRCEELRTTIATDLTELSSLSDRATNLDQAEARGLCPTVGRDLVPVSPELCRSATAPDALDEPSAGPRQAPLAAGMGAY